MKDGKIWRGELWEPALPENVKWHMKEGFEFKAYLNCWVMDRNQDDSLILNPDIELEKGHRWSGGNLTEIRAEITSITNSEDTDGCPLVEMIAFDGSTHFIIDANFSKDQYPGLRFEGRMKPLFYFYHITHAPARGYPSFAHLSYTWRIRKIFLYPDKEDKEYVEIEHVDVMKKDIFDKDCESYFIECEIIDQ